MSSRRDFLKIAVGAAAVYAACDPIPPVKISAVGLKAPKLERIRVGVIGLGARGMLTLREITQLQHSDVVAVCDNYPPAVDSATAFLATKGLSPKQFLGDEGWRWLVDSDLDAVYICTPWRLHVPMAVAAMRAGKHAFIEVPAAVTLEECWQLVEVAEETQKHCMMLENCCYGRVELMLLHMCREGVFGDLVHGEAAYLHDLRYQLEDTVAGQGTWRIREHQIRNGNLYPTHGLGPVAQYMSVNRGDRITSLVSSSSASRGYQTYLSDAPMNHPRKNDRFVQGDVNISILRTALGRTIVLQFCASTPRPYSRSNVIQGARGLFAGYPDRIHVLGESPDGEWETDLTRWFAKYEHPLWAKAVVDVPDLTSHGHGGMDFVMYRRVEQCLREGLPMDQDVYDAAAWSVISAVSEQSVARGGIPVEVPDFTRGSWQSTPPLDIIF